MDLKTYSLPRVAVQHSCDGHTDRLLHPVPLKSSLHFQAFVCRLPKTSACAIIEQMERMPIEVRDMLRTLGRALFQYRLSSVIAALNQHKELSSTANTDNVASSSSLGPAETSLLLPPSLDIVLYSDLSVGTLSFVTKKKGHFGGPVLWTCI